MLEKSRRITLKNFSMDYERPFFTEGLIMDAAYDHITLKIDTGQYPLYIEDNTAHFLNEGEWDSTWIKWFTEIDPATSAPAYGMGDSWVS